MIRCRLPSAISDDWRGARSSPPRRPMASVTTSSCRSIDSRMPSWWMWMKRASAFSASPIVACSRTTSATGPRLESAPRSAIKRPNSSTPAAAAEASSSRRRLVDRDAQVGAFEAFQRKADLAHHRPGIDAHRLGDLGVMRQAVALRIRSLMADTCVRVMSRNVKYVSRNVKRGRELTLNTGETVEARRLLQPARIAARDCSYRVHIAGSAIQKIDRWGLAMPWKTTSRGKYLSSTTTPRRARRCRGALVGGGL